MKNKLMKVSLLLFLMALIAGKSLSQNQPVRIKAEHPRLILSSTDIELMRGNALSGIEPWKTAWKKLESEIDGYADEKWKPNVYRGDASMSFYKAAIRDGSAARDLAIGYQITKDKRYAHKALISIRINSILIPVCWFHVAYLHSFMPMICFARIT